MDILVQSGNAWRVLGTAQEVQCTDRLSPRNSPKCAAELHRLGHDGWRVACNHDAERSILEQRRNDSLAQAIGEPLSGESPEELPSPRARSLRSPGNGRKTPSPLTLAAWPLSRKVRVWPSSNSARPLLVYLSFATKEHIRP